MKLIFVRESREEKSSSVKKSFYRRGEKKAQLINLSLCVLKNSHKDPVRSESRDGKCVSGAQKEILEAMKQEKRQIGPDPASEK